jgi:hypothetical protein
LPRRGSGSLNALPMLDRSASNLFQPASDGGEPSATVVAEGRTRPLRAARGAPLRRPYVSRRSPRASAGVGETLRGAASRVRGVSRYLPLVIAVLLFVYHALAGGGRPAVRVAGGVTTATPRVTRTEHPVLSSPVFAVKRAVGDTRVRTARRGVEKPSSRSPGRIQGTRRAPERAVALSSPGTITPVAGVSPPVAQSPVASPAVEEFSFER